MICHPCDLHKPPSPFPGLLERTHNENNRKTNREADQGREKRNFRVFRLNRTARGNLPTNGERLTEGFHVRVRHAGLRTRLDARAHLRSPQWRCPPPPEGLCIFLTALLLNNLLDFPKSYSRPVPSCPIHPGQVRKETFLLKPLTVGEPIHCLSFTWVGLNIQTQKKLTGLNWSKCWGDERRLERDQNTKWLLCRPAQEITCNLKKNEK